MDDNKKFKIFLIAIAVIMLFCITMIIAGQENISSNVITMLAGWLSGIATAILGGIAIWQNKSHKDSSERARLDYEKQEKRRNVERLMNDLNFEVINSKLYYLTTNFKKKSIDKEEEYFLSLIDTIPDITKELLKKVDYIVGQFGFYSELSEKENVEIELEIHKLNEFVIKKMDDLCEKDKCAEEAVLKINADYRLRFTLVKFEKLLRYIDGKFKCKSFEVPILPKEEGIDEQTNEDV